MPSEHVESCFRDRIRHFEDFLLRKAEDTHPSLAAHIDVRDQSEIATTKSPDSLFPDPESRTMEFLRASCNLAFK